MVLNILKNNFQNTTQHGRINFLLSTETKAQVFDVFSFISE
jgi:hypothetical protein